jgi:hypothetical protein
MSKPFRMIAFLVGASCLLLLLFLISVHRGYHQPSLSMQPSEPGKPPNSSPDAPDYYHSALSTTVDDFLMTEPIPLDPRGNECGILVFPQREFSTSQSLQAGVDHTSLMVASPEQGAPSCRSVWIAIDKQDEGFYLNEKSVQDWVKARDEYTYRLVSAEVDHPNDWVAALWRNTLAQKKPVPGVLTAYGQDDGVRYCLYLGALPAKVFDDPQWKQATLGKQTADPLYRRA